MRENNFKSLINDNKIKRASAEDEERDAQKTGLDFGETISDF